MKRQSRRRALVNTAAAALLTRRLAQASPAEDSDTIRPENWGAFGDGVRDDTKALQSAMDNAHGKTVLLTGKSYRVSGDKSGILKIPSSGIRLRGNGQRPVISCVTDDAYILKGDSVHDVEISRIGFAGPNAGTVGIGITGASSKIRISECTARYCGLYHGTSTADTYANVNKKNSPVGVQIQNCTGTGSPKGSNGVAFIAIDFHSDVLIAGCHATSYQHGIVWWGGDSAVNANGAPGAERKTSRITIKDCHISNMDGGGIWGSMGRNIKVVNCVVDRCGDVGFDAEGCQEVTFRGGKVSNCANGCLTTFWGARNIVFENINVELSGAHKLAFRSYNATLQATFAESVSILGGSITCKDGIGWLDQANGPLDSFVMRGTKLTNVIIEMVQQNIHDVTIEDVTIDITLHAPEKTGAAAIAIGNLQQDGRRNGKATVRNCKITSWGRQSGLNDCAIAFTGADRNADSLFWAQGNRISGFGNAFSLTDVAGKSLYQLQDNQLGGGQINRAGLSEQSRLDVT